MSRVGSASLRQDPTFRRRGSNFAWRNRPERRRRTRRGVSLRNLRQRSECRRSPRAPRLLERRRVTRFAQQRRTREGSLDLRRAEHQARSLRRGGPCIVDRWHAPSSAGRA
eukprot:1786486-Alexandrium_andersonii.AAC.1